LEVSGVLLFLPPKGGFGLFNLSQVTAKRRGWAKSRTSRILPSSRVHGL